VTAVKVTSVAGGSSVPAGAVSEVSVTSANKFSPANQSSQAGFQFVLGLIVRLLMFLPSKYDLPVEVTT
jgi:hypothetical protein